MTGKIVNEGVEALGTKIESWGRELDAKELSWERKGVLKQKQALMSFLDRLLAKVKLSMPKAIDDAFYQNEKQYIDKFTKIFESKLKISLGKEAKYLRVLLNTIPANEKRILISELASVCHVKYVKIVDKVMRINFAEYSIRELVVVIDNLESKYPKISPPKTAGKPTKESWLKKLFGKKAQPPKGTVVVEKGITPPKGGKLLGFIGGVAGGAALFVLDYPGIAHGVRISDGIYYDLKLTSSEKYHGDVHSFAKGYEFYFQKDISKKYIFSEEFREKYPILDFHNEYTQLALVKEKHKLSDSEWKYLSNVYLGIKKSFGSLKFSAEELIAAYRWYNKLNDKEFKQKYSFENLLVKYNKSKTDFRNAQYIQKMGIDLEKGGGNLVLREVLKRMYANIALNEFKRPILKTRKD